MYFANSVSLLKLHEMINFIYCLVIVFIVGTYMTIR